MQSCAHFHHCTPATPVFTAQPTHPPIPPTTPASAPITPALLQPHMSRSIQRVAHHHHWWPSSLGPPCLCHFLCVGLLVHVTLCSRVGRACCFTSCLAVNGKVLCISVTVLLDVLIASSAASLHYAVSEYDGDSFYGTLHSLLACSWMTVFTAHKWSSVHIFWVIRRTVRRHTQREMHTT